VWRDINGKPGQEIYSQDDMKVQWSDNWPYRFFYYRLDTPLVVTGTFYIGWEQYQAGSLNVGFDANHDEHERIFYTVDETWYPSNFNGALLIRPVVGAAGYVGITGPKSGAAEPVNIYPNPTGNSFRFNASLQSFDPADKLVIYNLMGAEVKVQNLHSALVQVNNLPDGLYIVKLRSHGNNYVAKLIIHH